MRRKVQVTLLESPGAEQWFIVTGPRGWFKVPGGAPVEEVFRGALEGWTGERGGASSSHVWVRITLSTYRELLGG